MEDAFDYILDEMGMDDPYSFEEAEIMYSVITGIIGMEWYWCRGLPSSVPILFF